MREACGASSVADTGSGRPWLSASGLSASVAVGVRIVANPFGIDA
jgi:hypothetical protein